VGAKTRQRLAGIECPWCLHLTEYDPAGKASVKAFPLDMAAQVRQAVTAPAAMAAPAEIAEGNPLQSETANAAVQGD